MVSTVVVNTWNVFKSVTNNSIMQIKRFRELLSDVITSKLSTPSVSTKFIKIPHNLIKLEGKDPRKSKKKCKMVSFIYEDCEKPYCLQCFQHKH